jgi:hypothetical protein
MRSTPKQSRRTRRRPGQRGSGPCWDSLRSPTGRDSSGAVRYEVAWRNGHSWVAVKTHMGYNQETYDTVCASLSRSLQAALRWWTTPERVTIFTDAQAAIRQMASEMPGTGLTYALQARRHIASLRRARPDIIIEIRWCAAHKVVAGNENADEWARLAAEEPDARVWWLEGGSDTWHPHGHSRTSSGRSRKSNGLRHGNGLAAESPTGDTRCRRESSGRTRWWRAVP